MKEGKKPYQIKWAIIIDDSELKIVQNNRLLNESIWPVCLSKFNLFNQS